MLTKKSIRKKNYPIEIKLNLTAIGQVWLRMVKIDFKLNIQIYLYKRI